MTPRLRETHGRWPWAAAACAAPASAALVAGRARVPREALLVWAVVPATMWHETEEWVYPGGFLPWFNREVLGGTDEFPITRRLGFAINVGLGWGFGSLAAASTPRAPWLGGLALGLTGGNVVVHAVEAVRRRGYNPGLATAVGLLAPVTVLGLRRLFAAGRPLAAGAGAACGFAAGALLFATLRARARRS